MTADAAPVDPMTRTRARAGLLVSVFVVATSGLVYELVTGTLASYVLGDSVTQFSLVIGLYLSAMGLGSYLSSFVERRLLERFVDVELGVAIAGGLAGPSSSACTRRRARSAARSTRSSS